MTRWLIVAGDFTLRGGMDAANFGLAGYLARQPHNEVHLVAHAVSSGLPSSVRAHIVRRPFGAHRFGEPFLRAGAGRWRRRLGSGVHAVANGGNAALADVNWVHYVHAAFQPRAAGLLNDFRVRSNRNRNVREEAAALRQSRLIICNSRRTAEDVVRTVGVPRDRTEVVYYGTDPARFGGIGPVERQLARRRLCVAADRPVALFAGALGNRRKNFDTLFDAWRQLCASGEWDVDLLVAGSGAELDRWQSRASEAGLKERIRFLGFRPDMPFLMAACDVLVHPARYEPYGLSVHEALCRGVPAIVSADAGIAERYPEDLRRLLVGDPDSASELAARLRSWRSDSGVSAAVAALGSRLRSRTWDHMAGEIASIVTGSAVR